MISCRFKQHDVISIIKEIQHKYYTYKRLTWPQLQSNWLHDAQFVYMGNTVSGDLISAHYLNKCTKIIVHIKEENRINNLQHKKLHIRYQQSFNLHKGDCGRPLIIAGSSRYHGAAFFSATAAMRAGADYAYLLTRPEKLQALSSMSPDLIVQEFKDAEQLAGIPFTSLVIGPGIDRDKMSKYMIETTLQVAKQSHCPIVIDADGLYFVIQMIRSQSNIFDNIRAILTPNHREFNNLYIALFGQPPQNYNQLIGEINESTITVNIEDASKDVAQVAQQLNCIIVVKNLVDIITDGQTIKHTVHPGSPRRCSGQGDILSGIIGALISLSTDQSLIINQCVNACEVVKCCNQKVWAQFGQGAITSDFIQFIPQALMQIRGDTNINLPSLIFK